MAGMLYYPLMDPPAEILNQALLYWDGIATILPRGDARPHLGRRLVEAGDAGLYRPVFTRELGVADLYEATTALGQLARRFGDEAPPGQALTVRPDTGLHSARLGDFLTGELLDRGLARTPEEAARLVVSPLAQAVLLGMIARRTAADSRDERGRLDAGSLIPYTDSRAAHRLAFQPLRRGGRSEDYVGHGRTACWTIELGSLLPVPHEDVPVADLVAFRTRHEDERRRFTLALDTLIHRVRRDHEHPNAVLAHLRGEFEQARTDLVAAGRAARIGWTHRSIAVTVSVAGSYAASRVAASRGWFSALIPALAVTAATAGHTRATAAEQAPLTYLHRLDGEAHTRRRAG